MDGTKAGERRMAVGIKQTMKSLLAGKAAEVFLAQDAEPSLLEALRELALANGVPQTPVPTMRELGKRCGIQVPTAAAARLRG